MRGRRDPVALALKDLVRGSRALPVMTCLAVSAMVVIIALSMLLIVEVIPFSVQGIGAGVGVVAIFAWVGMVGHAGLVSGVLPRALARWALTMGIAAPIGALLVGLSLLLPSGSLPQYVVGGAGLLLALPAFLAFPVWLIALSGRLRTHLDPTEHPAG